MIHAEPSALLIRPDLAEAAVEGLLRAKAYRATEVFRTSGPVADILDDDGHRISQLLFGEAFDSLLVESGRHWGRSRRDGVIGWIAEADLTAGIGTPSHRVAAPGGVLPFNSLVDPTRDAAGDVVLMPLGEFAADLAAVAESMIDVPHSLGGRTEDGMDCAALVQACLMACGRAAPRHTEGQAELGRAVARDDVQRGDLILWRHAEGGPGWTGHSAIALDAATVIHASGRAGSVCRQSLDEADTNQRAEGFDALIIRRL